MNAVITGATKGIGKAIAHKLAAAGYDLAICSRNAVELENFLHHLRELYPAVQIIGNATDCSSRAALTHFVRFVQEHFTVPDVLVNNAGVYIPSFLLDEDDSVLDDQWAVNLFAPYFLSKLFGRQMRDRRSGHIVNICSIAAVEPVVTAGSYTVTKQALLGLTTILREELRPFNVKVSALLPGATLTSSWGDTVPEEGSFIKAEEVASCVLNCLQMSATANIEELIIRPLKKPPLP